MKKFLLFAAAAIVAVSASAQLASKKAMPKSQASVQQKIALPQAQLMKMAVAGERKNAGKDVLAGRIARQFTMTDKQMKNLKSAQDWKMAQTAFRRAAAPEYIGTGFVRGATEGTQWQVLTGTSTDGATLLIKDVIPNPFTSGDLAAGVYVPYVITGGQLTIAPTLIASFTDEEGTVYVFLADFESEDGYIRLDIEDDGVIQTINSSISYAIFTTANFDATWATYDGVVELVNNVKYRRPGDAPEPPTVLAQPGNTVLFAGRGSTGYGYLDNLALLPAYTEFTVNNGTQDYASSFKWTANEVTEDESEQEIVTPLSANTKNFVINTNPDAAYEAFKLVGYVEDVESEEYTWGYGHCLDDDGAVHYTAFHGYPGGMNSSFKFSDDSYATMTTQDPDGDLTFYTNWATPDLATNSMCKIYCYQGKPAAPIYFTGVTLPLVAFKFVDETNFKLHINVYKCQRSEDNKLKIGDLIAQSDVTSENVGEEILGVTNVVFDGFYVEDEDGMSEDVPYLQLDEEFLIEIEGWDNGTFSGVLGAQAEDINTQTSVWFARTGYPTELRSYTAWFPTLFIGLNDAITGYLHTTDATDITIANEGGEATINVEAMLRSVNSETGSYDYRLFIDEVITDSELDPETGLPTWLSIGIGDISESGTNFTLGFSATPLGGELGRQCIIKFMQEGAFLTVTIKQGEPTAISSVKTTKLNGKSLNYNLAGQRVGQGYKGLVIKDGQKFMVK